MSKKQCYCKLCNTPYNCCSTCEQATSYTGWRKLTDNQEHYKIYTTLVFYKRSQYTKEEAKALLLKCDLSDISGYRDEMQSIINEIMSDDTMFESTNLSDNDNSRNTEIDNVSLNDSQEEIHEDIDEMLIESVIMTEMYSANHDVDSTSSLTNDEFIDNINVSNHGE